MTLPWLAETEVVEKDFSAERRKKLAAKGHAMADGSFPIENESDLANARQAVGRAAPEKRAAVRAHIKKRAKALGVKLEEGGLPWLAEADAFASPSVRDHMARFRGEVRNLPHGGTAKLPDGTAVARVAAAGYDPAFAVDGEGTYTSHYDAAAAALDVSARKTHPESIGGDVAWPDHQTALDHAYTGEYQRVGGTRVPGGRLLARRARHAAAANIEAHGALLTEGEVEDLKNEAIFELLEDEGLLEVGTTHERTIGSKGKGLFGMKGAQLPAVIQHVYNDLVEGGKPPGGLTYRLAIGIVRNWSQGKGAKDPKVIAKAQAAMVEWEKLRAQAHARSAAKGAGRTREAEEPGLPWLAEIWSEASRKAALGARRLHATHRTGPDDLASAFGVVPIHVPGGVLRYHEDAGGHSAHFPHGTVVTHRTRHGLAQKVVDELRRRNLREAEGGARPT